ncbi:MAG: hypothetical protein JXR76_24535 [Deltaproteobacteria bacterium]|nr:hypothetical protein [Deltaproteobacteria bacterium]
MLFPLTIACGRIGFEKTNLIGSSTDNVDITDLDADSDTDSNSGSDTESTADAPTDSESVIETDSYTDSDSAMDTSTGMDTGTGFDTVFETDGTADTDADTDTQDTDSPMDSDSGPDCSGMSQPIEIMSDTEFSRFGYYYYPDVEVHLERLSGSDVTGAWRAESRDYFADTTSAQLVYTLTKDIVAGDYMVTEFWTRCARSDSGNCRTGLLIEENHSPWTNAAEYYLSTGSSWEFHQVPFVVASTLVAGNAQIAFRLGYHQQAVEIFPARVLSYGDAGDTRCLPNTTNLFTDVEIISAPRTTTYTGIQYIYRVEVNGKPTSTISVSGLPAWLDVDIPRKRITGIPDYADMGTTSPITVTAASQSGTDQQTWTIEVAVDPALEGHWPLDETSGTFATDASGNGRDGTLSGDPVWQPAAGQIEGALSLDGYQGALDYVALPSVPAFDNLQTSSYTLSAWVRPNSQPQGTAAGDNGFGYAIIIKPGGHTGLWYRNDLSFVATHYFDGSFVELDSGPHAVGQFYHVAAVMDLDVRKYILYVNGGRRDELSLTGSETARDFGAEIWRLGIANPAATTYRFEADIDIDDVRLYSRALTIHEIESLAGTRN